MGSSQAVPVYDKVVDNSQEYVASSPAPQEQAPQAQVPQEQAAPAPAAPEQAAQKEGSASASSATPAASAEQGTPGYIEEIRQQLAALNSQLGQNGESGGQDPSMAIEEQLLALQRQAEEGEITYSEMIRQTAPLIEERASMRIKQDLQQEEEAKQIRGAQDAFLAENPDFIEFTKSPEAQAIRQANPIMDNVSAYYAYKAESAKMEKANLQTQIDDLRMQMQNTIKGAAGQQGAVAGTGGGESLPIQNLGRNDGLKPFEGGLAALKRARAAQA